MKREIKEFIGVKAEYDEHGGMYIWGVNKKGENQRLYRRYAKAQVVIPFAHPALKALGR